MYLVSAVTTNRLIPSEAWVHKWKSRHRSRALEPGHVEDLLLALWESSMLISTVASPGGIPTLSEWGLSFPHILASICCQLLLIWASWLEYAAYKSQQLHTNNKHTEKGIVDAIASKISRSKFNQRPLQWKLNLWACVWTVREDTGRRKGLSSAWTGKAIIVKDKDPTQSQTESPWSSPQKQGWGELR